MLHYIIPKYIDLYGDCCIVNDSDIEITYHKGIKRVIQSLYKEKYLDSVSLRQTSNLILNQKNLLPLVYSINELLIPIKVRRPLLHNDPSYGYVNIFAIKEIRDNQIIVLYNNKELCFMDNIRTLKNRLKMARQVLELNTLQLSLVENKLLLMSLSPYYERLHNINNNILFPPMPPFLSKNKKPTCS